MKTSLRIQHLVNYEIQSQVIEKRKEDVEFERVRDIVVVEV